MLADTEYYLSDNVILTFYRQYVRELMKQFNFVKSQNATINANGIFSRAKYGPMGLKTIAQYYRNNLSSSKRNVFGKKLANQIKNHSYFRIKDFISSI